MDNINFNIEEHFATPEILSLIKECEEENEFEQDKSYNFWKDYTSDQLIIAKIFHIATKIGDEIIKCVEMEFGSTDYSKQDFAAIIKIKENYYKIEGTSDGYFNFADYDFETLKQVFPVEKTIIAYE